MREPLEKLRSCDDDPHEALMIEYANPTSAQTIYNFRPGRDSREWK